MGIVESQYALFDRVSGALIEGLTFPQLKGVLVSIGVTHYRNWLIWREGEESWNELQDVIRMYLIESVASPPPLPKDAQSALFSRVNLSEDTDVATVDQRLAKRFDREVEVWIDHNGQISHNEIIDISISGVRLKSPVSIAEGEIFWLILRVEPNPIQVMAKMTPMGVEEKQPRVLILPNKNIDLLREFLLRPEL